MQLRVTRDKGFTLVELMIVVGIIGILSLMALPVYANYIKKVRLTEVLLNHLYLSKQLETEFNIGGAEAVFNYVNGTCYGNHVISGTISMCDSNIGLSPGRMIMTYKTTDEYGGDVGVTISIKPQNKADEDFNMQSFNFLQGWANESVLFHFPKHSKSNNQPIEQRSGYGFIFVQQIEGIKDTNKLKITKEDSSTYFADFNRWYCGGIILNNTDAEMGGPIPKGIRPSMCKFTAVDGSVKNFLED